MSVDKLSQDFLKVLLEYGGSADTTTLRSETGMSRGQINHRYRKLDGLDWIEISRAESGEGERTPPKIAEITDEGMQAIRSGEAGPRVLGKEVNDEEETLKLTREQLKSFQQEIEGMKNQLNVVVDQINNINSSESIDVTNSDNTSNNSRNSSEKVEKLEQEVNRLGETVKLLNKSVSEQRKKESERYSEIEEKLAREPDGEIDEELLYSIKDSQDSFKEWKSIAEVYLTAIRLYMQEDDNIDANKYFEQAQKNN